MTNPPRAWIRRVSKKREAERKAAGETHIHSSIAPSSKPKKLKGHSRPDAKQKRRKTPIAKVGKQKAKRQAKNAAYYKSPEWKAKKQAVHERDGFQCVEVVTIGPWVPLRSGTGHIAHAARCPNRGEVVNHRQTSRGLVAEEKSYGHRGIEGAIDRIVTRCKDCDRRLTPLERINHSRGFNNGISSPRGISSNG